MTDQELVQRGRQEDREAQREIYTRNADRVYRLLLRMTGNVEDASELTQDVFLRVFKKLAQFDERAGLGTWIYQIAINEGRQFLRKRKRQDIRLAEIEPGSDVEQDHAAALRLDVAEALDRLPEEEKTLLVLRYFEQQSYAEMAETLDKPPGTIASGLNRARKLLQEKLALENMPRT